MELTQKQVLDYEQNGYLFVPELLSAAENSLSTTIKRLSPTPSSTTTGSPSLPTLSTGSRTAWIRPSPELSPEAM